MSEYLNSQNDVNDCVPIKVNRIFDSCSDRDCLSGIQVTLADGAELTATVTIVKTRCVRVDDVTITVEPVPFNRGFYSIDVTYSFGVELLGYSGAGTTPTTYTGTAVASKNTILYGGESAVKTFFSDGTASLGSTNECCRTVNLPTASVSVVEPIALETRIGTICVPSTENPDVPCVNQRVILLTLGLFSVIELTRPMTIMVPTLDYTIPKKECFCDRESPCEIFEKLKFPEEEFSPLTLNDTCGYCGSCGGMSNSGTVGGGCGDSNGND